MGTFKRFKADCRGNTAVVFALSLVPMLLAAGAAIDMVQTNQTLTVLQGAADAAAVAGGSSNLTKDSDLQKIVEDYMKANNAVSALDYVEKIESNLDKKTRTFSVSIKGKRSTSLMKLAGIDTMDLNAYSEVKLGGDGLEVALVLDNTGSMNEGGRLPALKTAAKLLVDEVMKVKTTGAYVKIGVVPFSDYVNVGLSRRKKPWMDVDKDSSVTTDTCWDTYPDATKYNCRQEPDMNDGVSLGTTHEACDWNYGTPVKVCGPSTSTNTWYGCVGSRAEPMDESIGTVSSAYKGLMNVGCASEIVELTDDQSKLESKIDGLIATGATYIPAGLLWGWHMLDSQEPLSVAKSAADIKDMGGAKALILMTDGQNTLGPYSPYHWGADNPADWARGDAKMAELCGNIKKDDITVYTVAFMVTDPKTISSMSSCASDSSKAFTADNAAELAKAFKEVGASLTAMRISK
jgi:Putative Flp pilus-assembly TadE/G-like/von Willebrand factor type A domain